MSTNLRVHIAPVGFEFRRVTDPLIDMQADKVYLVTFEKGDKASKFFQQIKDELYQNYRHIKVEEVFINLWNLYDCIRKFREIILQEKDNHVYINVSTGTKITAIAGTLASMLEGATPYYAHVSYRHPKSIDLPTEDLQNLDRLPVYEIRKPNPVERLVLSLLDSSEGKMRKSKLIEKLEDAKIIRKKDEKIKEFTETAKHSQLRAILDPLENEWEYVKVESSGRRSEVSITDKGRTALNFFGTGNI